MFARLADPDRRLLNKAPVNLVVFSLTFGATEPWPPQVGIRWRKALEEAGLAGKLLTANQQQMTFTLGGPPPESRTRRGYQFAQDNGSTATLYEDGLVLETRQYDGWQAHRGLVQILLEKASALRGIAVETNISLRYVNALSDERATTPAFWHNKVQDPFLGPASDNDLLADFKRGVYLLTFNDGTLNAEVRVGIQPDAVFSGAVAFVFDMEFTDTEQREFDLENTLGTADSLNTAALKMFQRILSPDYLRELGNG